MNVSLTPELEQMIATKVESGMYNTASEVVREGLRLIQERDETRESKLAWLKDAIRLGMEDVEAGRVRDGREVMQELREKLLRMKRERD